MKKNTVPDELLNKYSELININDRIPVEKYERYDIKKGLRDKSGKGVLAGVTNISRVTGVEEQGDKIVPVKGQLYYRGYDVHDLVDGALKKLDSEKRTDIYEEAAFLLLMGKLPTAEQLSMFRKTLAQCMTLPRNFTRDVIMKAPSKDLMNSLTRSVLTLQSYDRTIGDQRLSVQLMQCIKLISQIPMLAVYGYHAYNYSINGGDMYIRRPKAEYTAGENILMMLRQDGKFQPFEAAVLDIALMLHMEHGGGNNSTFTTRVVTSTGSDTYSTIAASLCSLKGPKHGGANIKVVEMMKNIRENVSDIKDEDAIEAYIDKMLDGEVFDRKRLVYGIGHAVYSLSDPRAEIFKLYAEELAKSKGRKDDFDFYRSVENAAVKLIPQKRHIYKGVCCNVDLYSGLVYDLLGIPVELFTPLFATARIVGWSAHRMEEIVNSDKIIRPAYQSVVDKAEYLPIDQRN
ncbi:MAG: citrate synthase [Clostridiales bacterium]|nr:citrate synthase [Clostridiales bacterium]